MDSPMFFYGNSLGARGTHKGGAYPRENINEQLGKREGGGQDTDPSRREGGGLFKRRTQAENQGGEKKKTRGVERGKGERKGGGRKVNLQVGT